jgi:hypothetical protein
VECTYILCIIIVIIVIIIIIIIIIINNNNNNIEYKVYSLAMGDHDDKWREKPFQVKERANESAWSGAWCGVGWSAVA